MPRSSKGYTYISVFLDSFSKYIFIRPLRKATATAVSQHFYEDVILKHGAPSLLQVDNGKQYTSHHFKNLCSDHHVKIRYNIPYTPRNNPTERVNQTLETMICSYVQENHRKWDQHLYELQSAINTSPNSVTGLSPHLILFGSELVLDGRERQFDGNVDEPEVKEAEPEDSMRTEARLKLHAELKEKLKTAKQIYALRYNLRRRKAPEYLTGDMVWRRNFIKSNKAAFISKKLAHKWVGPFKIKEKVGQVCYMLEDDKGSLDGPWHVEQLKKHRC